jgi:hypothetical protein
LTNDLGEEAHAACAQTVMEETAVIRQIAKDLDKLCHLVHGTDTKIGLEKQCNDKEKVVNARALTTGLQNNTCSPTGYTRGTSASSSSSSTGS